MNEMDKAREHRLQKGKHVVPVPTIELKPHFSGYLVDSLSSLWKCSNDKQRNQRHLGEKSIVRPVFSYCGKLVIEDSAIEAIVRKILIDGGSVNKVAGVEVHHVYKGDGSIGFESQGVEISCAITISYGKHIPTLVQQMQLEVKKDVERLTGMAVKKVNITIKALFVQPKKM